MTQNPCYALVAVHLAETSIEAIFFNLFLCGGLKLFTLKINTLERKLQISEKYLYSAIANTEIGRIFVSDWQ